MPSFTTPRNTRFRYARTGAGGPLVCVPGGPLLPPAYLGTLGGLDRYAELVLPEPPEAETPDDGTYRCDRLAADLEALRRHLRLERLDLLGHSAGANIVLRYAERYPGSVGRLLLVAPSTRAVGIAITDEARAAVARSRAGEPWYPAAAAALARIQAGTAADGDWAAIAPFSFGRWDGNAAAYNEAMEAAIDPAAAAAFGAAGALDPPATRAVLAALDIPVTVIAGAADVGLPLGAMEELARLFPSAGLAVLENAGHFPWVDEPAAFVAAARRALAR